MERKRTPVTGVILSGGKCLRMGSDKAFCLFREKEMIRYAISLLEPFADEIILSANSSGYEDLGYRIVPDIYTDAGPMGGLHAAFSEAAFSNILVLSCDMPLAHPLLLEGLLDVKGDFDAIVPLHDGWKEPLLACYHRRVLPVISEFLERRQYKLMHLLDRLDTFYLDVSDLARTLSDNPFANINTPEDLARFGVTGA